jgi:hypothetical protein
MPEIDREALKNKFNQVALLRAKAKGTSYKEEYLAMTRELRERAAKNKEASGETKPQRIVTTGDYEIDPNKDLDEQIGAIIEGEMRDLDNAKAEEIDEEMVERFLKILKEGQIQVEPPIICSQCANLNAVEGREITCKAFPEGIPQIILSGRHDHRTFLPGQKIKIKFNKLYRIDPTINILD